MMPPSTWTSDLVDDLDDAPRTRVDEHGVVVDDGVVEARDSELGGHVLEDDAVLGQDGPDLEWASINKGRPPFAEGIDTEPRTAVDPENAVRGADRRADGATNDRTEGASLHLATGRALAGSAFEPLGLDEPDRGQR